MSEEKETKTTGSDVEDNKTMAILAYLVFFLPLLTSKDSDFGKFHANQGLLVLLLSVAVNVVGSVVPVIGWFLILPLGWIAIVVFIIMGMLNASKGLKKRLPMIGGFDIIK